MKMFEFFGHWKKDLPASVVVFLVALPLCLGIALASGAPLLSGIIAGVIGGVVIGFASGSPLGVSGPAAGLTAVVLSAIAELGSFEALLVAVVLAGALQVCLGIAKAGIIAYYFPNAVIKGMLTGIGVIIVLKQIPHGVGYDRDYLGDESFFQGDQHNTLSELLYMLDSFNAGAVIVTIVGVVLMVLWDSKWIKHSSILSVLPGPLMAVVSGIFLAKIFQSIPGLMISKEHFVTLPSISGLGDLPHPDWSAIANPAVWKFALVIAAVASLETLLCTEATDKMDPDKRITPTNRELIAQGVGNMASGALGGLPLTQVIVRSSANIQAQGRTKLSAITHGILLLGSVLLLPVVLRMIPLASLAAILLLVGYKLIKPSQFRSYWHAGPMQFAPFAVTVVGVAFTDLLTGVVLGLAVAIMHILWKNYKVAFHYDARTHKTGTPIHIQLSEDVTFLNKAGIKRTLHELPANAHVILDATRTMDLDPDVMEIIEDYLTEAARENIQIDLLGFQCHLPSNGRMPRTAAKLKKNKTRTESVTP